MALFLIERNFAEQLQPTAEAATATKQVNLEGALIGCFHS